MSNHSEVITYLRGAATEARTDAEQEDLTGVVTLDYALRAKAFEAAADALEASAGEAPEPEDMPTTPRIARRNLELNKQVQELTRERDRLDALCKERGEQIQQMGAELAQRPKQAPDTITISRPAILPPTAIGIEGLMKATAQDLADGVLSARSKSIALALVESVTQAIKKEDQS